MTAAYFCLTGFCRELQSTVLPQPLYSPDLAPNGHALFEAMKKPMRDQSFKDKAESQEVVFQWVPVPSDIGSARICGNCQNSGNDALIFGASTSNMHLGAAQVCAYGIHVSLNHLLVT